MIHLDFSISPEWEETIDLESLDSMDELDLRYSIILGDIVLEFGNGNANTDWGWIPLLDWAESLRLIRDELRSSISTEATFEFTESNSTIRFRRSNDIVSIEASYVEAIGECSFDSFSREVDRVRHAVFHAARDRYPSLGNNVAYKHLETAGQ
ncbi:MAG: hypothetical protein LW850_19930 [Planctomycetaceae bacterium]|jgi:hypothetical protein|nr:hypothetical protein [Planctomycetaceae bacterium]